MSHESSASPYQSNTPQTTFWTAPIDESRVVRAKIRAIRGLILTVPLCLLMSSGISICVKQGEKLPAFLFVSLLSGAAFAAIIHFLAFLRARRSTLAGFLTAAFLYAGVLFAAGFGTFMIRRHIDANRPIQKFEPPLVESKEDPEAAAANTALVLELKAKLKDYYNSVGGDDSDMRVSAIDGFIYRDSDLSRLFPTDDTLQAGLKSARATTVLQESSGSDDMRSVKQGKHWDVDVSNLRTNPNRRFARVVSSLPKDIPVYLVSYHLVEKNFEHGVCVKLDDRWVWVPNLEKLVAP